MVEYLYYNEKYNILLRKTMICYFSQHSLKIKGLVYTKDYNKKNFNDMHEKINSYIRKNKIEELAKQLIKS